MKTRNYTQGKVNTQFSSEILRASVIVISLVLISLTVTAQDFWKQFFADSPFEKVAATMMDQSAENIDATSEITRKAVVSNETQMIDQYFLESAEVLTASETDALIEKYAEKQISLQENQSEFRTQMIKDDFINSAETLTASETDVLIGKYAQQQILMQEKRTQPASLMTNEDFFKSAELDTARGADREINKYAQKQIVQQENRTRN